ncbi:hypothetical protein D3C79_718840 [compost metagenome]
MTTLEPGARDVFTQGLVRSPLFTAFFANRPAAIITLGLEVLVHEVIAAITTAPLCSSCSWPLRVKDLNSDLLFWLPMSNSVAALNALGTSGSATRSCGRFGPARLATTVDISSASVLVNTGSSPGWRHMPCALA